MPSAICCPAKKSARRGAEGLGDDAAQALALLEEEKLIARRHGSGTCIVRKSNYHGGELEGFNYQMQVVGVTNYRNKVIEFTLLDAPPAIAQQLKIQPGEKVYYVRRLRLIDEVPILVENSYIPFATFPGSAWVTSSSLSSTISKRVPYHHYREPPQLYPGAGDP